MHRWWLVQEVFREGFNKLRDRREGVDNEVGRGKGQTIIVVATKETIAVAAGEATLNSLFTLVTFREIVSAIGLRGFSANFVSDDNLKWAGTVGSNMPITLNLLHIMVVLILKKSLSAFLSLTSFLGGGGRVLDL